MDTWAHGIMGNKEADKLAGAALMEFLLIKLLTSPLLWAKKSSGVI